MFMIYKAICSSLFLFISFGCFAQNILPEPNNPLQYSYAEIKPVKCSFNDVMIGKVDVSSAFNLDTIASVSFYFSAIIKRDDGSSYYTPLSGYGYTGQFVLPVKKTFSVGDASIAIFDYIRDSLQYNYDYK